MSSPASPRPWDEFTFSEIAILGAVLVFAVKGLSNNDPTAVELAEYYQIDVAWARETVKAAKDIGVNPYWLAAVIQLESGWDPTITNPLSTATGLIQFVEPTARALGTSTEAISRMSVKQQLGLVRRYFSRGFSGRSSYPTFQSLAMQVFLPGARSWDRSREFPEWVQDANPNIRTVGDYMSKVERRLPPSMRPQTRDRVSDPIDVSFV